MTGSGALLAAGAAVAWSNAVLPRIDQRWSLGTGGRSGATFVFCMADAALARARIPIAVGATAGVVATGLGLRYVQPVQRAPHDSLARWVLLDIPFGTAIPEEILFRGAISPGVRSVLPRPWAGVLGPLVFGAWHVGAALTARDSVVVTVGVTSTAGALLDALHRRTRSVWPGVAVHWGVNAAGSILSFG